MIDVVCASANPDKVAEIEEILGEKLHLRPRPASVPDVVEDADTLLGNARLKANAVAAATGSPALADDTGLEVAALGGVPGVRSARYAGDGAGDADNRAKLLRELDGVDRRDAAFHTVVVIVWPDGAEVGAEGVCAGVITTEERGDRGFGYDSIFVPDDGGGLTFAEMSAAAKHRISHRGRALRALLSELERR